MRNVGEESRKTYQQKIDSGFFVKYMSGKGSEPGFSGYLPDVVPILENCDGWDLKTPGYDGKTIPVVDGYYDYVYTSHTLEHISERKEAVREWFRVIKMGGHIVCVVPHQFLYEKKLNLPSNWNGDHRIFFTPANLLQLFEESLVPNSYRVRLLEDTDVGFDYNVPPEKHSCGCYEITLVIQKIERPKWELK